MAETIKDVMKALARDAFEAGHFAWPNQDAPSRAEQFERWWTIAGGVDRLDALQPEKTTTRA